MVQPAPSFPSNPLRNEAPKNDFYRLPGEQQIEVQTGQSFGPVGFMIPYLMENLLTRRKSFF